MPLYKGNQKGGFMTYCTSCGSPIPEGQGKSCSMCYGDIEHGKDGYYRNWADGQLYRPEQEQSESDDTNQ